MPQKVAAKNEAKPVAKLISRLVNQPRSPTGTPKKKPEPKARGVGRAIGDAELIQVEYRFVMGSAQDTMTESLKSGLVQAVQVARETPLRQAPNGIHYAAFGETNIEAKDLDRMVQAVPAVIAAALAKKGYYFVPLALNRGARRRGGAPER